MFQRNIVVIALVLLVAVVVLIFGRGLLSNLGPAVQDAANATAEAEGNADGSTAGENTAGENTAVDNANLSAEQIYARDVSPLVDQMVAWHEGPVTERATALEEKMETGALSTLTYGNFLLLYLNAHAAGRNDLAMDWIASETVGPRLQPIYETIAADSAAISESLSVMTPPGGLAETQQRLLQCLQYETQRSQAIYDVLAGTGTVAVPERSTDPCATVEDDLTAMRDFVAANQ
ncbi:hypothetical protein GC175_05500 [bacterium]|nr:hypothetical protein [bacterium]